VLNKKNNGSRTREATWRRQIAHRHQNKWKETNAINSSMWKCVVAVEVIRACGPIQAVD